MSTCSRCGKCHSFCPVYNAWLDERFSPRGKYHLLKDAGPQSIEEEFLNDLAWSCLQCEACRVHCPSGVDVAEIIRAFRISQGPPSYVRDIAKILSKKGLGARFTRTFKALPFGAGLLSRMVKVTPWGTPQLPRYAFLDIHGTRNVGNGGEITLFVGCVQNFLYPEIPEKALRVSGGELNCPREQTCCGLAAWSSGLKEEAKALALRNLSCLITGKTRHIVTFCSSCEYTIREVWPRLFEPGSEEWDLAQRASRLLVSMNDYMIAHASRKEHQVILHEPCHLRHLSPSARDQYYALAEACGWQVMGRINACCGQGGTFAHKYPEMSKKIFEASCKKNLLDKNHMGLLLTPCSGCLLQWRMGLKDYLRDSTTMALHPIELL